MSTSPDRVPPPLAESGRDGLGRPTLTDAVKRSIASELAAIPLHKRAVVVVIGQTDGTARAHFAARLTKDGDLKVAAGGGWDPGVKRPDGYVGIEWAF